MANTNISSETLHYLERMIEATGRIVLTREIGKHYKSCSDCGRATRWTTVSQLQSPHGNLRAYVTPVCDLCH